MSGTRTEHEKNEKYFQSLIGNPEGKGPLDRLRRRWEDNIKLVFREIEYDAVDWIHVDQNRNLLRALVNTVMNRWAPRSGGFFFTSCASVCSSRRTLLRGVS
jgi:hypothetical protein